MLWAELLQAVLLGRGTEAFQFACAGVFGGAASETQNGVGHNGGPLVYQPLQATHHMSRDVPETSWDVLGYPGTSLPVIPERSDLTPGGLRGEAPQDSGGVRGEAKPPLSVLFLPFHLPRLSHMMLKEREGVQYG